MEKVFIYFPIIIIIIILDDYDPIQIAEKELLENKIPYIIRRILPDGTYEDCKNLLNLFPNYKKRGCKWTYQIRYWLINIIKEIIHLILIIQI